MKVLIFYAKYGGGHLSAANAIKETIKEKYPETEITMVDCMEYVNKAINKITIGAYTQMTKRIPKAWGKIYKHSEKGIMSEITKGSNKFFAIKLKNLINKTKPDIIISAHPFSTQMCAFLKKHKKIKAQIANILTDFEMHEQWIIKHEYIDYFFISNEKMKEHMIKHGIEEKKIFVTGIPISQKFNKQYDKKEILKEFKLKENKKTILFFAGGKYGLAPNNIYEFIEILAKNYENIQVVAISGKNEKIYNKFNEIVEKYNKKETIKIIEYTEKVPQLMSISDIVITKPGGITASESISMKVPIIAINPIPGQEEENAQYLEENKLAIWVKKGDNIEEKINEIITNEKKIEEIKENLIKIAKPNAAENICKTIFEKR